MSTQVRTFEASSKEDLDRQVNEFAVQGNNKIINVSHATAKTNKGTMYSATVQYSRKPLVEG